MSSPATINVPLQEAKAAKEGYPHRVAVALDIFLNVLADGLEDETISSRVRRVSDAYKSQTTLNPLVWLAEVLNAGLNVIQSDHGQKAQAGDLERATTIINTEDKALGI